MKKVIYLSMALAMLGGEVFGSETPKALNPDIVKKGNTLAVIRNALETTYKQIPHNVVVDLARAIYKGDVSSTQIDTIMASHASEAGYKFTMADFKDAALKGQAKRNLLAMNVAGKDVEEVQKILGDNSWYNASEAQRQSVRDLKGKLDPETVKALRLEDPAPASASASASPQTQTGQGKKSERSDVELIRFALREKIADVYTKLADPLQREALCTLYSNMEKQIVDLAKSVTDINDKLSKIDDVDSLAFVGTSNQILEALYSKKFDEAKPDIDAYLEKADKIVKAGKLVKLYVDGKPDGDRAEAFFDALTAFVTDPAAGLDKFLAASTKVTAAPDWSEKQFTVPSDGSAKGSAALNNAADANAWFVACAKSLQTGTAKKKFPLSPTNALNVLWSIKAYNDANVGKHFSEWTELLKVFPTELKKASDAQ